MNTRVLDRDAILEKYPEQKPICLNYAAMRAELLALAAENEELRSALPGQSVKQ